MRNVEKSLTDNKNRDGSGTTYKIRPDYPGYHLGWFLGYKRRP